MAKSITLNICHLYPDLMDTYGDKGNIITIIKRCQWRNINVNLTKINLGDSIHPNGFDFYFFGGGQDNNQQLVAKDLVKNKNFIQEEIQKGKVLLSICGGYQLLQKYFKTNQDKIINGIGLFDAYTVGSNQRMIQNILVEINPDLTNLITKIYLDSSTNHKLNQLIGFENHSGKTFLGNKVKPLGVVIKGNGNNGQDKTEGAIYKNAFGCYMHGSLLPKNPHFTDYLISKSLELKYGKIKLKSLDDTIEWQAHTSTIQKSLQN